MTPIETNKPVFFDTDGSPLEGGLIYIGQPSTDPRTNPKTVTFRDSGGSEFTAKQPLKTNAGRIVYNGLPIVSLVDGEYSMLIINANGQQVDYSRSVNSGASGGGIADFSEVTRVGLTLDEVKAFNVSVGEVVRNVGKETATDDLGAEWLALSATGSPGDDVDLIDFTNGLQGQRVNNVIYSGVNDLASTIQDGSFNPESATEIFSGSSTSVSLAGLPENGPGMYVIRSASVDLYIYVNDISVDAGGTVTIGNPSTNFLFWTNAKYTSGNFQVISYTYDAGTITNSANAITKIYKV